MSWYNATGKENDVVVSSRVRFARNIADYPFDSRLDETSCREIIDKVEFALGDGFKRIDMNSLSAIERSSLVEKHYASTLFANKKLPHALFVNDIDEVSAMVCEEDHVRLQCIMAGLALDEAYNRACVYEEKLDKALNIAFNDEWGYLTHCPTNLGTGMRASVMMFLPALTATRAVERLSVQLSKLGITVRGAYGEGSDPEGCLYQISNSVTMGITEEDTLKKMNDVVSQICEKERKVREKLAMEDKMAIKNRVGRSYGVMKYAAIISSREFMKLYADVRLGISLGLIEGLSLEKLGDIMINVLPATLTMNSDKANMNEYERDIARAEYIKKNIQ